MTLTIAWLGPSRRLLRRAVIRASRLASTKTVGCKSYRLDNAAIKRNLRAARRLRFRTVLVAIARQAA